MRISKLFVVATVAAVALVASGLVLAGGHGCTQKAESCATDMKAKYQTKGWLGIEMDQKEGDALTVTKVFPASPAEAAGFQVGDQLLSVNGIAHTEANHEKLMAMKKEGMKIGDKVTYEVQRGSNNLTLEATLVKIPEDVLASMIEKHKKEDHKVAKN